MPDLDHPEDHPESLATSAFLNYRLDPEFIGSIRTTDPVVTPEDRRPSARAPMVVAIRPTRPRRPEGLNDGRGPVRTGGTGG